MQRQAPAPARGEQRIGQRGALVVGQQRGRHPGRLIGVQEPAGLAQVATPEDVGRRRARPLVGQHHLRRVLLEERGVPQRSRRHMQEYRRLHETVVATLVANPVEERLPRRRRALLVDALEDHGDLEHVLRPQGDGFAPGRVEQAVAIEGDEALDQPLERRVRVGLDASERPAKGRYRQFYQGRAADPGQIADRT